MQTTRFACCCIAIANNEPFGIGKRCPGAATRAGAGAGAACCHTCWCWCSAVLQSHAYKARPNFRLRRRENARLKDRDRRCPRIEIGTQYDRTTQHKSRTTQTDKTIRIQVVSEDPVRCTPQIKRSPTVTGHAAYSAVEGIASLHCIIVFLARRAAADVVSFDSCISIFRFHSHPFSPPNPSLPPRIPSPQLQYASN